MFQELKPKDGGFVGFGGNQKGKIVGIGRIGKGSLPSIDNVLYVEGLKHNLLSIVNYVTMDIMLYLQKMNVQ